MIAFFRRCLPALPWAVRVLWAPDVELDLLDGAGKPDHGKVVGVFAFAVDVVLITTGLTPPLGHFIALNSVVFGWLGWRTFLKSKAATSQEEIVTEMSFERNEREDGVVWEDDTDQDHSADQGD